MAADKYIKLDLTSGRLMQQQAVDTGGSGNAGKIVALNSAGFIDPTMLSGGDGGGSTISIIADANLAPGDWINIFYTTGQRRARKATATDATIPAHGFVQDTISATSSGLAYLDTINPYCVRGSLTTADIGKRAFLSTTGGSYTLTPPSTTGNLIQVLGVIVDVNTGTDLVQVDAEISDGYVV